MRQCQQAHQKTLDFPWSWKWVIHAHVLLLLCLKVIQFLISFHLTRTFVYLPEFKFCNWNHFLCTLSFYCLLFVLLVRVYSIQTSIMIYNMFIKIIIMLRIFCKKHRAIFNFQVSFIDLSLFSTAPDEPIPNMVQTSGFLALSSLNGQIFVWPKIQFNFSKTKIYKVFWVKQNSYHYVCMKYMQEYRAHWEAIIFRNTARTSQVACQTMNVIRIE